MDPVDQVLGAFGVAGVQLEVEKIVLLISSILKVLSFLLRGAPATLHRENQRLVHGALHIVHKNRITHRGNTLVRKLTPTLVGAGGVLQRPLHLGSADLAPAHASAGVGMIPDALALQITTFTI